MLRSFSNRLFKRLHSPEERLRGAKMIACDLDGTLLDGDDMIAPSTVSLIKKIESLGIPFVMITRRHHQAVEPYAEELMMTDPVISLDGSIIRHLHANTTIATLPIDQEFALDIADEVDQTGDVACCVVTPDAFLSTDSDIPLPGHHQHWNIETGVVETFERIAARGGILQMIVAGSYYGVNTILKYTEEKMRQGELKLRMYESHSRTDRWFLEIRSAKATKYNALVRLLEEYTFGLDAVIGIGDNYNDLDFCRKAGYVVAVKNAVEDLREMADFVTRRTCLEAGIDEFFRYFLEIRGVDRNEIDDVADAPKTRRKRSR